MSKVGNRISAQAHAQAEPNITASRQLVLDAYWRVTNGGTTPATVYKVSRHMLAHGWSQISAKNVAARCTELTQAGLLRPAGTLRQANGYIGRAWLPVPEAEAVPLEPRPSRRQLEERVAALEAEVAGLRRRLARSAP